MSTHTFIGMEEIWAQNIHSKILLPDCIMQQVIFQKTGQITHILRNQYIQSQKKLAKYQ
jgi:hypothetical protein